MGIWLLGFYIFAPDFLFVGASSGFCRAFISFEVEILPQPKERTTTHMFSGPKPSNSCIFGPSSGFGKVSNQNRAQIAGAKTRKFRGLCPEDLRIISLVFPDVDRE